MSRVDPERNQFVTRYAAMSDEELLKIARRSWELSDLAWDALEDELEERDLDLPEPETVPDSMVPQSRSLVMLRRFRDIPEAMLAKGKLDSVGIDSVLADDNTVRMDWLWSNMLGGVKLLVDPDDFAKASRILNEPIPPNLQFEAAEVYRQPRCPKCQSLDVMLHRKGWICHACNHAWEDDPPETDRETTNPTC